MILFKVFYKKYTKDEPMLIGFEKVNDKGNWESNLKGKTEWQNGVISINEHEGILIRKQFVIEDVEGELLFEGDQFTVSGNTKDAIFTLKGKEENLNITNVHGESSASRTIGYDLGWVYGNKDYTIKLYNE